jgi:hypothetical protein
MLRQSSKGWHAAGSFLLLVTATALIAAGSVSASRRHVAMRPQLAPLPSAGRAAQVGKVAHVRLARIAPKARRLPRATTSLYEHSVRRTTLRRQGCRAAEHGVSGIVILDFGQPAYNGHTYGTFLFSGRFAGNKAITRALLAYAHGYAHCLRPASKTHIMLSRGTNNYHPQVPSAYQAGRRWARETRRLSHLLAQRGLAGRVTSAAADDAEPAWDRPFHRTRDFFRGYRDAHTGHLLYNYGSLDGGVGAIWNARQAFYVASGMRDSRALPEIYNARMARQWARLALTARRLYHRPLRFAGVLTSHQAGRGFLKPRDAHRALVTALASYMSAAPAVPATVTNIRWSE